MKKLFILVLFYAGICTAQAQTIFAGAWEGKLNAGVTLRVVFHIAHNADGNFSGTLDSPDQGAMGLPCSNILVKEDSIIITMEMLHASYAAAVINDTTIEGIFQQGGGSFPLTIYRTITASVLNRPQTPKPPFDYNIEQVEYNNADKSIHYSGTFTYPKGDGPFVTALLITGSGQQDRDETIFAHKPFAVIADYLSKNGIAVLRVDDRGVGKSTGDVKNATSADFAEDVETSLGYLKSRKETDKKKTGLIGHSEGGLIAAIVASRNKDVDFIITLAGPGTRGDELLAEQNKAVFIANGIPENAADAYISLFKTMMNTVVTSKDTTGISGALWNEFTAWKSKQPLPVLEALKMEKEEDNRQAMHSLTQQFSYAWMKYFLTTNPQEYLEKVKCKVLALNGSKDIQVIAASNLPGIKKALEKSKSPDYSIKELPGLNHLFQHCTKCSVDEYGQLEETFSSEALAIINTWLQEKIVK